MNDDARVQQLLREVLEADRAPEDVCATCPELLPLLHDRLDRIRRVEAQVGDLFPSAARPARAVPPQPATVTYVGLPEIAGYELHGVLGSGGMGVVYLAKNLLMDRLEVLKLVNPQFLGQPGSTERFMREIQAAARLRHPNIVTAYSAVQAGALLVLAMEYVEGEDLGRLVETRGPLPVGHACAYAYQAAMGLAHAHEQGMVHRDIKPGNLILAQDGKRHVVKILDFGLAKATCDKEGRRLTAVGTLMGTPDYMAPEQIVDAAGADIRADIYSLGCTLYFLLSGQRPFAGKSRDEVLDAHRTLTARPLDQVRADVPRELAAVVGKMMAKAPAQRYAKPAEVAQALTGFAKGGLMPQAAPAAPAQAGAAGETEILPAIPADTIGPAPLGATRIEGKATIARAERQGHAPTRSRNWRLSAGLVAAGVLTLAVAIALFASGLFGGKPAEGVLVIKVDRPNVVVYVDDEEAAVAWSADGKTGEVRVSPGTHHVAVKQGGKLVDVAECDFVPGQRHTVNAVPFADNGPVLPKKPPEADLPAIAKAVGSPPPAATAKPVSIAATNDVGAAKRAGPIAETKSDVPMPPVPAPLKQCQPLFAITPIDLAHPLPDEPRLFLSHDGRFLGMHVHIANNRMEYRLYAIRMADGDVKPMLTVADAYAICSPDGKSVAIYLNEKGARTCKLYALDTEEAPRLIRTIPGAYAGRFSGNGKRLVGRVGLSLTGVWDTQTGEIVASQKKTVTAFFQLSPDGKHLAYILNKDGQPWNGGGRMRDPELRIWSPDTGAEQCVPVFAGNRCRLAFSPDSKRLACSIALEDADTPTHTPSELKLLDTQTGKQLISQREKWNTFRELIFSADSSVFSARYASDITSDVGNRCCWSAETGVPYPRIPVEAWRDALSADGRWLAVGGRRSCSVWDTKKGLKLFDGAEADLIDFSSDGKRLVLWSKRPWTVRVVHTRDWKNAYSLLQDAEATAGLSPDRKLLLVAPRTGPPIRIWDVQTGELRWLLEDQSPWEAEFAFSRNSKRVASYSRGQNSTVIVWSLD